MCIYTVNRQTGGSFNQNTTQYSLRSNHKVMRENLTRMRNKEEGGKQFVESVDKKSCVWSFQKPSHFCMHVHFHTFTKDFVF